MADEHFILSPRPLMMKVETEALLSFPDLPAVCHVVLSPFLPICLCLSNLVVSTCIFTHTSVGMTSCVID